MIRSSFHALLTVAILFVLLCGCKSTSKTESTRSSASTGRAMVDISEAANILGISSLLDLLDNSAEYKRELPQILPKQKGTLDSAIFYVLADEPDLALSLLNNIDKRSLSDSIGALLDITLSRAYWLKKDFQSALAQINSALEIDPKNLDALNGKGVCLKELGRAEDALVIFDSVLAVDPNHYMALSNRGWSLSALRRHNEAITDFDATLKIKPGYSIALNNKGWSLMKLGRHEEAIAAFDAAHEIKPDYYEPLINKGYSLSELGRFDEAVVAFDAAHKVKPEKYLPLMNKGSALTKLSRHEEAIAAYDMALKVQPDSIAPYYNIACAYSLSKKKPEMLKALAHVIEGNKPFYAPIAQQDPDFDFYRSDPDFRKLVGLE